MASAAYYEELTCLVCRTFFTDPVTLPCGHSFCRECVAGPRCPQCETAVHTEAGRSLPTSLTLERLAEKLKQETGTGSGRAEVAELCPEHEERFKLFCVTEQQLTCIVCRDEERHDGHKFKPVKEAAASLRRELEEDVEGLRGDIAATESLADTQREVMEKTKKKSQQLATQIHRQFEEMHQFLRKRENEVKNELQCQEEATMEGMRMSLDSMEIALSESRESEAELTAVLLIEDSEGLLKSWTQGNSGAAPERSFRPRANDLQVVDTSLSLGPYQSHLQFFVWKEMLQVIQPRAELLSFKSTSTDITVSDDGRSLFCTPESEQTPSGYSSCFGSATASGQNTGSFGSTTASGQNTGLFGFATASGQKKKGSFDFATASRQNPGSFGSATASGQNTGSFGSATASGQNTGSFGSATASGQNTGSFGSATASGKNTGSFDFATASGQNTGSFGSATASGQNTGSFGSAPASGQNAGSFGFATASGQNAGSFGFATASGQNTGSFGFATASRQNAGSFGSAPASGQNAGSFGFAPASGQNTGSFGSATASGQNTGSFGSATASGQNTGSFGSGLPASSIKCHVFSVNQFTSGQHYWETEVGHRDYWALGIKDHFLKYDAHKYCACSPKTTTELALGIRPRKIGIYLNCSSRKLSFYDADTMTRIHTLSSGPMSTPLSAYFHIRVTTPDRNPLTACWY